MKKLLLILNILFSVSALAQVEKYIPPAPNPPRLVNDLSKEGLLTEDQKAYLEQKLDRYDDTTSNQIAIVIVDDLHGYDVVDYAVALGRKWGVGGSKFNNGVVILVSTGGGDGNRDAFIASGYGLEGAIPDITAKAILENELIPSLKSGNYYQGFNQATDAIIKAAAGEYKAPAGYRNGKGSVGKSFGKIIVGIIILFVILSIFGGGRGNGGGGYVSRRGSGWLGPFILGEMLGSAGRGGGGWSGGSGGGFGGGGGGFGGFGGGGFGGGGAGGKW
jgi:uncharacterized protein